MIEIIFLNAAGSTLFSRADMESGHWVQEEMSVTATFPYDPEKVIERGQRIAFRDPATDNLEVFEIRQCSNHEPDHYQQIVAEHISLAELQDEHINRTEITNKTASQALTSILSGTLWSVGTNTASGTQSADIARGSVWQAVTAIKQNWNCYITPRVVISSAGVITGRYLDITPAQGVWRGVRLSVHKNLLDPSVTYNDEDVLTALYGYGGSVDVPHSGSDDTTQELTFAGVTWTVTQEHPAKPAGQTYLEWPEKTAIYGRNGRARFGYYQNTNIKDANLLLQKTWEALRRTSEPKISISGTCEDLYRIGYSDEPLRLHDLAIVEIEETGETFRKEITKLDVDLIDPTGNHLDIGDYIPNIVYISRDTSDKARGGGGGGGRGQTPTEAELSETFTAFEKTDDRIGMVVGTRNGGYYVKAGEIALAINKSGETGQYESTAYIDADHVNISGTQTVYALAGSLEHTSDGKLLIKDAGGLYVRRTEQGVTSQFGVFDQGNLTGGIIVQKINGDTTTAISGDRINISGTNTVQALSGAMELDSSGHLVIKEGAGLYLQRTSGGSTAQFGVWDRGNLTGGVMVTQINGQSTLKLSANVIDINGLVTSMRAFNLKGVVVEAGVSMSAPLASFTGLTVAGDQVSWQSKTVVTDISVSRTATHNWAYVTGGTMTVAGYITDKLVLNVTKATATINYLGKADS